MIALTATATCLGCDWTAEGNLADADKAAGKHTEKLGHSTSVTAVPAKAVS